MKSSRLLALALGVALALLALPSSAQTPPKTPPPSRLTPAQTEERIKQLETRADAAEKAAASAAMEKDYITRVQKQYESYYEKAFNTTITIFGLISVIIAVISLVAGKLGLDFFDRRVQSAIAEASSQLRAEITNAMKSEIENIRKENAAQSKELDTALTSRMAQVEQDLKDRSYFQFQAAQGLAAGADGRFDDARENFRNSLVVYKACMPRRLFPTSNGASSVQNIFVAVQKAYPDTTEAKAKEELADPLYNDLDDELASAALDLPWLAPLVKDRGQKHPTPSAPPISNPS